MKIKEITNEGFISSFAKSLLPAGLQKAIDPDQPAGRYTEVDLAKAAYEKYGPAPGFEKTYAVLKKDPRSAAKAVEYGHASWLRKTAEELKKAKDKESSRRSAQELMKKAKDAILGPLQTQPGATQPGATSTQKFGSFKTKGAKRATEVV
jgi:hypothetical protein